MRRILIAIILITCCFGGSSCTTFSGNTVKVVKPVKKWRPYNPKKNKKDKRVKVVKMKG